MAEREKAKYRLVVLGLVAVLGLPALETNRLLTALYALALILYALWSLRLTVVFASDPSLGPLLCLLDAVMLTPFALLGRSLWLGLPMGLLWTAGAYGTYVARRAATASASVHSLRGRENKGAGITPASRGRPLFQRDHALGTGADLALCLQERAKAEPVKCDLLLLAMRLQRYQELCVLQGEESAERALVALAKRVRWVVRETLSGSEEDVPGPLGFRLADDLVALVFTGGSYDHGRRPPDPEALAALARRFASGRLVNGLKLEVSIGWAWFPADGVTLRELLQAAERSAASSARERVRAVGPSRLAVG